MCWAARGRSGQRGSAFAPKLVVIAPGLAFVLAATVSYCSTLPMRSSLPLAFLVIVTAASAGLGGCVGRQGQPVAADAQTLVAQAGRACRRHDPDAWQMLVERLASRHPDTPAGKRARRLLGRRTDSTGACSHALRTAESNH